MSQNLINILNIIYPLSILVCVLSVPFLLFNWIKYVFDKDNSARKFPLKSVLFFSIPVFIGIIGNTVADYTAENKVQTFVNGLSGNYTVLINDKSATDGEKIVNMVKNMYPYMGQHSHPTKIIKVEIQSDKGKIQLEFQRDSVTKQEYWVYYPNYGRNSNLIGAITTSEFDDY